MKTYGNETKPLRELRDFKVEDGDADVRGWKVRAADGQALGTVSDLIVNTTRMKVEYLELEGGSGADGRMVVPIDGVEVNAPQHEVVVTGAFAPESFSETRESGRQSGMDVSDSARLTRSEEELKVGKQRVAAGEVVVAKHVETEHVSQPVTVEHERVRIERRPVTASSAHAEIGADEIRIPVMEEELVVEKRAVVREELVISKERESSTETVEADLRREEFDVDSNPETLVAGDRSRSERGRGGF